MDAIRSFNIMDMAIIAILLLSVISGMYKGFLSSGLTTVGFGVAFFGAKALYPQLAHAILGNTQLMNPLKYYLDSGAMFRTVGLAEKAVAGAAQNGLLQQAKADLESRNFPEVILRAFQTNVAELKFDGFNTFEDYLNMTIINAAVNVVSFLILFVVAYVLVLLIVNLFNNVFRFPLLKHFDWLLGGMFGFVRGFIIVSLVLAVVPLATSVINVDVINALATQSQLSSYFSPGLINDIIREVF